MSTWRTGNLTTKEFYAWEERLTGVLALGGRNKNVVVWLPPKKWESASNLNDETGRLSAQDLTQEIREMSMRLSDPASITKRRWPYVGAIRD